MRLFLETQNILGQDLDSEKQSIKEGYCCSFNLHLYSMKLLLICVVLGVLLNVALAMPPVQVVASVRGEKILRDVIEVAARAHIRIDCLAFECDTAFFEVLGRIQPGIRTLSV